MGTRYSGRLPYRIVNARRQDTRYQQLSCRRLLGYTDAYGLLIGWMGACVVGIDYYGSNLADYLYVERRGCGEQQVVHGCAHSTPFLRSQIASLDGLSGKYHRRPPPRPTVPDVGHCGQLLRQCTSDCSLQFTPCGTARNNLGISPLDIQRNDE